MDTPVPYSGMGEIYINCNFYHPTHYELLNQIQAL